MGVGARIAPLLVVYKKASTMVVKAGGREIFFFRDIVTRNPDLRVSNKPCLLAW